MLALVASKSKVYRLGKNGIDIRNPRKISI